MPKKEKKKKREGMPLIFLLRNPPHSTPPQVPTKEFALAAPKPAEDLHDEARKSRLARDHESTTMMTALEGRPPPSSHRPPHRTALPSHLNRQSSTAPLSLYPSEGLASRAPLHKARAGFGGALLFSNSKQRREDCAGGGGDEGTFRSKHT